MEEGCRSEALWDFVKKHKARPQLRPTDWVGDTDSAQFLVTVCESDIHACMGTPSIL